jgi:hypothetical protein
MYCYCGPIVEQHRRRMQPVRRSRSPIMVPVVSVPLGRRVCASQSGALFKGRRPEACRHVRVWARRTLRQVAVRERALFTRARSVEDAAPPQQPASLFFSATECSSSSSIRVLSPAHLPMRWTPARRRGRLVHRREACGRNLHVSHPSILSDAFPRLHPPALRLLGFFYVLPTFRIHSNFLPASAPICVQTLRAPTAASEVASWCQNEPFPSAPAPRCGGWPRACARGLLVGADGYIPVYIARILSAFHPSQPASEDGRRRVRYVCFCAAGREHTPTVGRSPTSRRSLSRLHPLASGISDI